MGQTEYNGRNDVAREKHMADLIWWILVLVLMVGFAAWGLSRVRK